jgi:hypothetical protein
VIEGKKVSTGHFILFNVALVYAKPKDRLKEIIRLDNALIRDGRQLPSLSSTFQKIIRSDIVDFPHSFEITHAEKRKQYFLNASDYIDKLTWMNDLETRIESYLQRNVIVPKSVNEL